VAGGVDDGRTEGLEMALYPLVCRRAVVGVQAE